MTVHAKLNPEPAQGTTDRIARYAANLKYVDLPADVREIAHHGILDWLGCTVAGAADPAAVMVMEEARQQGGKAEATFFYHGVRSTALQAALVNGVAGHTLDFDDKHFAVPGHPSSPVLPVVFALGEALGKSGKDYITAYVIGVEVACRVGLFMGAGHYDKGWHSSGTVGTFGAAAAAGHLLGLNEEKMAVAFGIAGTQAAGLKSMFGSMAKSLNIGKASQNGLYAALLAARGFTSSPNALECEQGVGEAYSGTMDFTSALAGLNEVFHIRDLLFKYHASCYATHAIIEAAQQIRETQNLGGETIKRVRIRVPKIALKMCNIPVPRTGIEAKFSLVQTCSMALLGFDTGNANIYSEQICVEPSILRYRDLMTVEDAEALPPGTGEVIVDFGNRTFTQFADMRVAERDLNRQARKISEKVRALVAPIVGADKAIVAIQDTLRLSELPNARPVIETVSHLC